MSRSSTSHVTSRQGDASNHILSFQDLLSPPWDASSKTNGSTIYTIGKSDKELVRQVAKLNKRAIQHLCEARISQAKQLLHIAQRAVTKALGEIPTDVASDRGYLASMLHVVTLNNFARISQHQNELKQCASYLKLAVKICTTMDFATHHFEFNQYIASTYLNTSAAQARLGNHKSALKYGRLAIAACENFILAQQAKRNASGEFSEELGLKDHLNMKRKMITLAVAYHNVAKEYEALANFPQSSKDVTSELSSFSQQENSSDCVFWYQKAVVTAKSCMSKKSSLLRNLRKSLKRVRPKLKRKQSSQSSFASSFLSTSSSSVQYPNPSESSHSWYGGNSNISRDRQSTSASAHKSITPDESVSTTHNSSTQPVTMSTTRPDENGIATGQQTDDAKDSTASSQRSGGYSLSGSSYSASSHLCEGVGLSSGPIPTTMLHLEQASSVSSVSSYNPNPHSDLRYAPSLPLDSRSVQENLLRGRGTAQHHTVLDSQQQQQFIEQPMDVNYETLTAQQQQYPLHVNHYGMKMQQQSQQPLHVDNNGTTLQQQQQYQSFQPLHVNHDELSLQQRQVQSNSSAHSTTDHTNLLQRSQGDRYVTSKSGIPLQHARAADHFNSNARESNINEQMSHHGNTNVRWDGAQYPMAWQATNDQHAASYNSRPVRQTMQGPKHADESCNYSEKLPTNSNRESLQGYSQQVANSHTPFIQNLQIVVPTGDGNTVGQTQPHEQHARSSTSTRHGNSLEPDSNRCAATGNSQPCCPVAATCTSQKSNTKPCCCANSSIYGCKAQQPLVHGCNALPTATCACTQRGNHNSSPYCSYGGTFSTEYPVRSGCLGPRAACHHATRQNSFNSLPHRFDQASHQHKKNRRRRGKHRPHRQVSDSDSQSSSECETSSTSSSEHTKSVDRKLRRAKKHKSKLRRKRQIRRKVRKNMRTSPKGDAPLQPDVVKANVAEKTNSNGGKLQHSFEWTGTPVGLQMAIRLMPQNETTQSAPNLSSSTTPKPSVVSPLSSVVDDISAIPSPCCQEADKYSNVSNHTSCGKTNESQVSSELDSAMEQNEILHARRRCDIPPSDSSDWNGAPGVSHDKYCGKRTSRNDSNSSTRSDDDCFESKESTSCESKSPSMNGLYRNRVLPSRSRSVARKRMQSAKSSRSSDCSTVTSVGCARDMEPAEDRSESVNESCTSSDLTSSSESVWSRSAFSTSSIESRTSYECSDSRSSIHTASSSARHLAVQRESAAISLQASFRGCRVRSQSAQYAEATGRRLEKEKADVKHSNHAIYRVELQEQHQDDLPATKELQNQHASNIIATKELQNQHASNIIATKELQNQHATDIIAKKELQYQHATDILATEELQYQHASDIIATKELQYQHASDILATEELQNQHATDIIATKELQYQHAADIIATEELQKQHAVIVIQRQARKRLSRKRAARRYSTDRRVKQQLETSENRVSARLSAKIRAQQRALDLSRARKIVVLQRHIRGFLCRKRAATESIKHKAAEGNRQREAAAAAKIQNRIRQHQKHIHELKHRQSDEAAAKIQNQIRQHQKHIHELKHRQSDEAAAKIQNRIRQHQKHIHELKHRQSDEAAAKIQNQIRQHQKHIHELKHRQSDEAAAKIQNQIRQHQKHIHELKHRQSDEAAAKIQNQIRQHQKHIHELKHRQSDEAAAKIQNQIRQHQKHIQELKHRQSDEAAAKIQNQIRQHQKHIQELKHRQSDEAAAKIQNQIRQHQKHIRAEKNMDRVPADECAAGGQNVPSKTETDTLKVVEGHKQLVRKLSFQQVDSITRTAVKNVANQQIPLSIHSEADGNTHTRRMQSEEGDLNLVSGDRSSISNQSRRLEVRKERNLSEDQAARLIQRRAKDSNLVHKERKAALVAKQQSAVISGPGTGMSQDQAARLIQRRAKDSILVHKERKAALAAKGYLATVSEPGTGMSQDEAARLIQRRAKDSILVHKERKAALAAKGHLATVSEPGTGMSQDQAARLIQRRAKDSILVHKERKAALAAKGHLATVSEPGTGISQDQAARLIQRRVKNSMLVHKDHNTASKATTRMTTVSEAKEEMSQDQAARLIQRRAKNSIIAHRTKKGKLVSAHGLAHNDRHSITLQRHVRGHLARKCTTKRYQQEVAATRIQKVVRGKRTRANQSPNIVHGASDMAISGQIIQGTDDMTISGQIGVQVGIEMEQGNEKVIESDGYESSSSMESSDLSDSSLSSISSISSSSGIDSADSELSSSSSDEASVRFE